MLRPHDLSAVDPRPFAHISVFAGENGRRFCLYD